MATGIFAYIDLNGDSQTLTDPDDTAHEVQIGEGEIANNTDALALLYRAPGGNGSPQLTMSPGGNETVLSAPYLSVRFLPGG
jgi:hypothetical protein